MDSDFSEIETLVVDLYRTHGFDPTSPAGYRKFLRAILGPGCIERVTGMRDPAALFVKDQKPRIALRRNLPNPYAAFFALHECGHYVLEQQGHPHAKDEHFADLFAACAMAPRPATQHMYRTFGLDLASIAAAAGSTETWAALRVGEVLGIPLAAIAPHMVRVRGPTTFVWPTEEVVRRWVQRPRKGLRKIAITDATRRTVLVAEDPDTVDELLGDSSYPSGKIFVRE